MNAISPVIVVPLDGSDLSLAALPVAVRLAQALDAHVVLLQVVSPVVKAAQPAEDLIPLIDLEERRAREGLERAAERFAPRRAELVVLVDQDPAAAILDWLRANPADYVVMATHGRGGLSRLLTGSVTEAVLRSGLAPVVVVRPPEH